jgi:predicted CXXCH cytochrome family protein
MVTGSHHMQAYWVASTVGNGQFSLPFTYLFDEHRWVPRGAVFLHPPDERHQVQVWNISCITCHSTAGQPLAMGNDKAVKTLVGEMGIACEACHGPGERHIEANQSPLRRYWLHARGGADPTIVNPARLPATPSSQICGQCHALTNLDDDISFGQGKRYVPGEDLEATQPLLRPLKPSPLLERQVKADPDALRGYFWSDGTMRISGRDYSGMIESKCYQGGALSCVSCHSLHESDPVNLLAKGKEGDAACVKCHPQLTTAGAIEAHTHHRADSPGSRCYNCHMPYTVYGLLKGIRSHRIDSPKVTGRSGSDERPNACNLCHVDRSLRWTALALERWYHQPVPAGLGDDTPAAIEWLLSGSAVLRAVAAWQFGWEAARQSSATDDAVPYLVAALADPYDAVRYVAAHSLEKLLPGTRFDYLASPAERQRAAEQILRRWRAQAADKERPIETFEPLIKRLVEKRDNRAVRAME